MVPLGAVSPRFNLIINIRPIRWLLFSSAQIISVQIIFIHCEEYPHDLTLFQKFLRTGTLAFRYWKIPAWQIAWINFSPSCGLLTNPSHVPHLHKSDRIQNSVYIQNKQNKATLFSYLCLEFQQGHLRARHGLLWSSSGYSLLKSISGAWRVSAKRFRRRIKVIVSLVGTVCEKKEQAYILP